MKNKDVMTDDKINEVNIWHEVLDIII